MLIIAIILPIQTKVAEAVVFQDELNKVKKNIFSQEERVDFYMFASLGLSDLTLRQMFEYAKLYNGTIVLRGIENNSFRQTSEHIQRLIKEKEEVAIIIDPTLFNRFGVVTVPGYILAKEEKCPAGISCKPRYDKITGNITPRYALEKFAEKGDLFVEAQNLLKVKNEY